MSNSALATDLALLQEILGKKVGFCDASEVVEEAQETQATENMEEPSWETWHTKEGSPVTASNAWCREAPAKKASTCVEEAVLASVRLDCSALRVGETLSGQVAFCPWRTLVAYPTMFIGKANKPRAQPFFDTVLEEHSWDFFYLHDPRKPKEPPQLLVPTVQFEHFLRKINTELSTALTIPPRIPSARFSLVFGRGGTPKPRYLTHSCNGDDLERVVLPAISDTDIQDFDMSAPEQQDAFVFTLEEMTLAPTNPAKKRKALDRANQRASDRQRMMDQTQTLLGLQDGLNSPGAVFVGMDVEALEVAPHPVSEVGIAILDTNDIRCVPSGPSGSNWWQFIKAYHVRTQEYASAANYRYVVGCPDAFDFGVSTFSPLNQMSHAITSILEPYVCGEKEVIFVAHDTKQDVRYLSQIGLEVQDLPGMAAEIDTKELHQAWRGCEGGRGLHTVLSDLGIMSANLHSAGNDAVFTMRGMVGLAVEQVRKDEAEGRGEEYVPSLWTTDFEEK